MRRSPLVLALAFTAALAASPTHACRCAQRTLDAYFEQAEIVVIGRVLSVEPGRTPQGVGFLAVEIEPEFSQSRALKGDLDRVTLATSDSSASCGVEMRVGELYVLFASRHVWVSGIVADDALRNSMAWFDSCSGSRLYAGGPRAAETAPYLGLPVNQIVPRLLELAGAAPATPATPSDAFHSSPACWPEPRIFHAGLPDAAARNRVRISWRRVPPPDTEPDRSYNGAYRMWTRNPDTARDGPWQAAVLIDVERPALLWIDLDQVAGPIAPRWITEKLVYLRVPWGRALSSDLIIDVEAGALIHEEAAVDGAPAFEQFREACAGQCPCLPVPGTVETLDAAPASRPGASDSAATLESLVAALAFLNGHWDGRVFTEAGGRVSVRSALHGAGAAGARGEYPADVLEVRETPAGPWLHVDLYATSPCQDPEAAPVHRGWVPAFSAGGALVAGTYPGGC